MPERANGDFCWVIGTKIEANPQTRDKLLQSLEAIVGPKNFLHSQHTGQSWVYAFGYSPLPEDKRYQLTSLLDGTGNPLPDVPQELQDWAKKIRPRNFISTEVTDVC